MKTALRMSRAAGLLAALVAVSAAARVQGAQAGATTETKIAVIDIDRVAQESVAGKALFQRLTEENNKVAAERAKKEQELRDLQAKLNSEILSADAKEKLRREGERKQTDLQRWLEDAQREFQEKQQVGEDEFQKKLSPIVEAVAKELGIGLILRATPGLTFVLDRKLDITGAVVAKLDEIEKPAATEPPRN
jgi:Skp family chaperone for outer membrane proteins